MEIPASKFVDFPLTDAGYHDKSRLSEGTAGGEKSKLLQSPENSAFVPQAQAKKLGRSGNLELLVLSITCLLDKISVDITEGDVVDCEEYSEMRHYYKELCRIRRGGA